MSGSSSSSNNNSNRGLMPSNVHNLINIGSEANNQLADLIRVFQQQQQPQTISATEANPLISSLEPIPINPLALLQSFPLQTITINNNSNANQVTPPQLSISLTQALANTMGSPTAIANVPTTATTRPITTTITRLPSTNMAWGRGLTERQQFLIFVKILLKYIERINNPQLRHTAKAVVAECTRRNRMGDAAYTPLQAAVERRLRSSLGEVHWARAKHCFDTFVQRQNIRTVPPAVVTAIQAV